MESKDINFEYIEEFISYLVEKIEDDDELFATVVCKFNEAKEILKYLMAFDDIDFENIYLESPDEKGYTDEFCIELWYNDGAVNFSCDPLKVNGKYENPCGDETYLFDNCSSKIIPLCEGSKLYFVSIEEKCDCDDDCDCCKGEPYVLNVKLNLDTDEAEKIIRKYRNDFYKEIAIFKELLDF